MFVLNPSSYRRKAYRLVEVFPTNMRYVENATKYFKGGILVGIVIRVDALFMIREIYNSACVLSTFHTREAFYSFYLSIPVSLPSYPNS